MTQVNSPTFSKVRRQEKNLPKKPFEKLVKTRSTEQLTKRNASSTNEIAGAHLSNNYISDKPIPRRKLTDDDLKMLEMTSTFKSPVVKFFDPSKTQKSNGDTAPTTTVRPNNRVFANPVGEGNNDKKNQSGVEKRPMVNSSFVRNPISSSSVVVDRNQNILTGENKKLDARADDKRNDNVTSPINENSKENRSASKFPAKRSKTNLDSESLFADHKTKNATTSGDEITIPLIDLTSTEDLSDSDDYYSVERCSLSNKRKSSSQPHASSTTTTTFTSPTTTTFTSPTTTTFTSPTTTTFTSPTTTTSRTAGTTTATNSAARATSSAALSFERELSAAIPAAATTTTTTNSESTQTQLSFLQLQELATLRTAQFAKFYQENSDAIYKKEYETLSTLVDSYTLEQKISFLQAELAVHLALNASNPMSFLIFLLFHTMKNSLERGLSEPDDNFTFLYQLDFAVKEIAKRKTSEQILALFDQLQK